MRMGHGDSVCVDSRQCRWSLLSQFSTTDSQSQTPTELADTQTDEVERGEEYIATGEQVASSEYSQNRRHVGIYTREVPPFHSPVVFCRPPCGRHRDT